MAFLPALLYALLMSALPLLEVLWRERSPGVLLLLFWFETLLLLVTGAVRIVAHRRATAKAGHHAPMSTVSDHQAAAAATVRSLGDANTYLRGYLGFTSVFTLVHGVFVLLLVFVFHMGGTVSWDDATAALLYAIAVQVLYLLWDLPRLPAWSFARLARTTGQTGLRLLVTQLGLIFGLAVVGFTGSAWGMVGTFVLLRAVADASIAWLEGLVRQKDLPAGFARFLSNRAGQSIESLEAEFDAMKSNGREVEALLERPIAELRNG